MLRLAKYLILSIFLLALGLPLVLLMAGLQSEPLVAARAQVAPEDIARVKALVRKHDPRGLRPGETRSLEVTERDLALMLDHALARFPAVSADVDLHESSASILLTARVPDNPVGRFFNLRVDLSQRPHGIDVEGMQLGRLRLPATIARSVGRLAHRLLQRDPTYRAVLSGVTDYRLAEEQLVVVYQWNPGLWNPLASDHRAPLVDTADRERLLAYTARLAAVGESGPRTRKRQLAELLQVVFAEALARTQTRGDAAAENRAAIIAAMMHVQGVDVAGLLGGPAGARRQSRMPTYTLRGRGDLAQHFLLSAGIAAAGGSHLADAVGLFKEVDDSRRGSGFSFTDLAADRAGVRFTETATGRDAARSQRLVSATADETVFMPDVSGLPEFMPEEEFVRRYGGVDTPRFRAVADEIERRIAALPLHRSAR